MEPSDTIGHRSLNNGYCSAEMKKFCLILLLSTLSYLAKADHITGGEMYYTYNGLTAGENSYTVTLKLFKRCNSGREFPNPAVISVFNKLSFDRFSDFSVSLLREETISMIDTDPCVTDPPVVCYVVGYYQFVISLPLNQAGYILASEVNYRIRGISNTDNAQTGATYTCEIPGTQPLNNGHVNISATFTGNDLVVVCADNYFEYNFGARDDDGDELRYYFCGAYASTHNFIGGEPAGNPPYRSLVYNSPEFTASFPLGDKVTINPKTGLISGIAPKAGIYVVTVCVEEVRNTVLIATQRKDLQINITDCNVASALLNEAYMLCDNSRSIGINNQSNSPLIKTYDWEVLNPAGSVIYTSTNPTLSYTFSANGTYTARLTVNKHEMCTDTTSAKILVYPGLVPNFTFDGICIHKPTIFTDKTIPGTGTVNSWTWDFGQLGYNSDTSSLQNPDYAYPNAGVKTARLIVTTTNGCRDTILKTVTTIDKPLMNLGFYDTLVCVNDRLQLLANGTGNFSWSPANNMTDPHTASPTVYPAITTTYYANLEVEGCINRDSITVRVTDHVNLQMMADTTICARDTIALHISSDGLQYSWTPVQQVINSNVKNPIVITGTTTIYQVKATIGGCSTTGNVKVNVVPYPFADAGKDTVICYNAPAPLHALTDGYTWSWSPGSSLNNTGILNPVAYPQHTSDFVFTVYDNRGCPKPGKDTIHVTVLPKLVASAGGDTAVVVGQTLQLIATGGDRYAWSPPQSLSDANIANPVAIFAEPSDRIPYQVQVFNSAGCEDTAFINIKVYATLPTVFVPSAFTPNNDGINDVLRPLAVGMQQIQFFQIYNRWGQMVFATQQNGKGWDGRINGQLQSNNTYVWMVKAIDFTGAVYFKKGTVTLVR